MSKPVFNLEKVGFAYPPDQQVFSNISFSINPGESVCLLGANGSGKSTLLKILCGLIFPHNGRFQAFGQDICEEVLEDERFSRLYHRRIGFIFQSSDVQLFTTRVWDEVAFGPLQLGFSTEEVSRRVNDVLKMLGIQALADRSPHRLSGGEKKKVATASVLVMNPEVLILDEPTNGLDPRSQRWLTGLLIELNERGKTVVISTHNLNLAHTICRRALVLSEGHELVCDGPVREVLQNQSLLQEVNLIDSYTHIHEEKEHIHLYTHG